MKNLGYYIKYKKAYSPLVMRKFYTDFGNYQRAKTVYKQGGYYPVREVPFIITTEV